MGAQATNWALSQKHAGSFSARHLLTMLANECSDEQGSCRPTAAHLSELMGLDIRTIFRQLSTLEKAGLLYRLPQAPSQGRFVGREIVLLLHEKAKLYAASEGWCGDPKTGTAASLALYDNPDRPYDNPEHPLYDNSGRRMTFGCMTAESHTAKKQQVSISKEQSESATKKADGTEDATRGVQARARVSYFNINRDARNESVEPDDQDLWPQFEKLWPWSGDEPFEPARRAFYRLSPSERSLALQWAPAFVAAQKAKSKRVGMAKRYLSDKAFEPFACGRKKEPPKMVFVIEGTPAFEAWLAVWHTQNGSRSLYRTDGKTRDGRACKGIWRPTLFPPRSPAPHTKPSDQSSSDTPLEDENYRVDFEL